MGLKNLLSIFKKEKFRIYLDSEGIGEVGVCPLLYLEKEKCAIYYDACNLMFNGRHLDITAPRKTTSENIKKIISEYMETLNKFLLPYKEKIHPDFRVEKA